ncbi:MAG: C40 family peptidase [Clostridia bacterium]|nr:C40 family peptidase [Clostridia bacterium]
MKTKMNIKNIIVIAVICMASLFFINICFAANTGKIIVETAKLREEANTESKVLELASMGEEVEILEETEEWYKVKYKNITGYIRSDLIEAKNKENTTSENTVTENTTTETNNTVETENTAVQNTTIENTTTENTTVETNTTAIEDKVVEKGKYKISENIKLKVIPLISSIEMDEVNKDDEVEVIEILNDWVKVKTKNEKQGWIRKDKLVLTQENTNEVQSTENIKPTATNTTTNTTTTSNTKKTMYVNSQTVNLREGADKTSKVVKQLSINSQVTVLSTENGWAYIDINGTKGYVAENLLSTTKQEISRSATTRTTTKQKTSTNTNTQATTSTASNTVQNTSGTTASSGTGSSVISYAKQYLGCRYVYGGTSPSGFDCSGFTQYVYRHFGVSLNRTAAAQYSNGTSVTNLQAGDLVMFGKSGINHVGIYMGGNTFIHAANSGSGVRTDSLSSGYYKKNYVGARRIF